MAAWWLPPGAPPVLAPSLVALSIIAFEASALYLLYAAYKSVWASGGYVDGLVARHEADRRPHSPRAASPKGRPMDFHEVEIENPEHVNVIVGQTHFIKSAEDLHEALVNSVPGIEFGLAFCEASGPRLVRAEGTDAGLKDLAARNALRIGAGHAFIIFVRNAYPINVLRAIRDVPEVVTLYAATANPLTVLVAETRTGRGIVGVIDGESAKAVESAQDVADRRALVRRFGYKL
jgi:adenosine/AMP kinase